METNEPLILDENRFFSPDPTVREIAYELYNNIKDLPIVSPHGHVDPELFSKNKPFPDPAELLVIPDHYVYRMLYSQGISLEALGVPTIDDSPVETDHRKIWQIFGENYYLFAGTPTGVWLNHELSEVFSIEEKLSGQNAMEIYDQIQEKLQRPEFLPRAMFDQFNIEVLTTTDSADSILEHHHAISESEWNGKIIPTFRPDSVTNLLNTDWKKNVETLSDVSGIDVNSYSNFIKALENRRDFFKSMGAVATDHGIFNPYTHELSGVDAEAIFSKALKGTFSKVDADAFLAHILMEFARMSTEDGLVMQIHPGSFRNHNQNLYEKFGPDRGADIPIRTEYTENLHELLNKYGTSPEFTLIVFTLDETTYSRELAPLAGHYPALKLGPAWWFYDSIEGMTRYREMVTETAGIYNTVGFNDDTRAFPSIPARHDLSRRIDSNFLAKLVASHIIDINDARRMSEELAFKLVKKAYNL